MKVNQKWNRALFKRPCFHGVFYLYKNSLCMRHFFKLKPTCFVHCTPCWLFLNGSAAPCCCAILPRTLNKIWWGRFGDNYSQPPSYMQLLAISHIAELNNSFSTPAKIVWIPHLNPLQESKLNWNWKSSRIISLVPAILQSKVCGKRGPQRLYFIFSLLEYFPMKKSLFEGQMIQGNIVIILLGPSISNANSITSHRLGGLNKTPSLLWKCYFWITYINVCLLMHIIFNSSQWWAFKGFLKFTQMSHSFT